MHQQLSGIWGSLMRRQMEWLAVESQLPRKNTRKSKAVGGNILGLSSITTDPRGDPAVSEPHAQIAPTSSKEIIQETL